MKLLLSQTLTTVMRARLVTRLVLGVVDKNENSIRSIGLCFPFDFRFFLLRNKRNVLDSERRNY
jgi:hypothetical protein